MKVVPIKEVSSGSVLARELRDQNGSLILAKGSKLTESMIARIERMNIQELIIEGDREDAAGEAQAKLAILDHRFEGHEQDSVMMEIKRIIREHLEQT